MSDDTTPADVISANQVAEVKLQEGEDALSDGLSQAPPEDIREQYADHKRGLWQYRNYLLDLRLFLEECEEVGVFASEEIDTVAADWVYLSDQARKKYLNENRDVPA